jgi:hypothetical protein
LLAHQSIPQWFYAREAENSGYKYAVKAIETDWELKSKTVGASSSTFSSYHFMHLL